MRVKIRRKYVTLIYFKKIKIKYVFEYFNFYF